MATFLFDEIVFGPVQSRRLGCSLGINLLPVDQKLCSFNCVYCECGLNRKGAKKAVLPTREEVFGHLNRKLEKMALENQKPDVITFAGNGEPTMHPQFREIIDDTIELRDKWCSDARIAVLSNAFHLHKKGIKEALLKVDDNILKLDGGRAETIRLLDQPKGTYHLSDIIGQLKWFNGKLVIQTMFVRGNVNNTVIDNTTDEDLEAWMTVLKEVMPQKVMIYTIERDTPYDSLQKVPVEELRKIAERISSMGLEVQVSG
jgi:wyosine [tRNA(Phe)-imidazoG37] synthetase (radical SAM superfamily)